MLRSPALVIAAAAILTFATPALAKTIKVSPDDGPNALNAAVQQLEDGDKLIIGAGDYNERLLLDNLKDVKVIAKKGARIVHDAVSPAVVITFCTDVSIKGLTVVDTPSVGVSIAVSVGTSFKKLTVTGTTNAAVSLSSSPETEFKACTFANTTTAISVTGSENTVITRSTFDVPLQRALSMGVDAQQKTPDGLKFTRNTVTGTTQSAVVLHAQNALIDRNKISGCDGGVSTTAGVDLNGSVVSRNTIEDSTNNGVSLTSSGVTVTKNKIRRSGNVAVFTTFLASSTTVSKNKIDGSNVFGMSIRGDDSVAEKNTLKNVTGDGIWITGTNGRYEKNKILGAGVNGIEVTSAGNAFIKNTVKDSGTVDFRSTQAPDQNTFDGNQFGTTQFDG